MSYDAVLVARRGLGADELRLIGPAMAAAVRWVLFVDKAYEPVPELTRAANMDPPPGLRGGAHMEFIGARSRARELLKQIRAALLLDDGDG